MSDLTAERLKLLGHGNFKFKAFLKTNVSNDSTQSCELSKVEASYK